MKVNVREEREETKENGTQKPWEYPVRSGEVHLSSYTVNINVLSMGLLWIDQLSMECLTPFDITLAQKTWGTLKKTRWKAFKCQSTRHLL